MYKILTTLLLLVTTVCYGQGKYSIRKTYQYYGDDSTKAYYIAATKYNHYGKVLYEENPGKGGHTEMIKYYYLHDTILTKKVSTYSYTDDTTITRYIYDAHNRLIETRTNIFERQVNSCIPTGEPKEWGDTAITRFRHDSAGNILEEITRYKKNIKVDFVIGGMGGSFKANRIVYKYDNRDRPVSSIKQHIYTLNDRDVEIGIAAARSPNDTITFDSVAYQYTPYSRIIIHRDDWDMLDTTITKYNFDKSYNIITEYETNADKQTKTYYYSNLPDKRLVKMVETTYDYEMKKNTTFTNLYTYE